MNILALSPLEGTPGTRVFLDAARAAGHTVRLESPLRPFAVGTPADDGAPPDVVFTRMGASTPIAGFDLLRAFERRGWRCVNRSGPCLIARDKICTLIDLGAAGVPIPPSVFGPGLTVEAVRAAVGGPPWVVKRAVGTKGEGVARVDTDESLRGLLRLVDERLLVQPFLADAAGTDIRVLVVGGTAVAAMRRTAPPGEWRSNLHAGGVAAAVPLDAAIAGIAERAATQIDLDVAGVDLLPTDGAYVVAEVNGSPGLAGLVQACGPEPVAAVVRFLERLTDA